MNDQSEELRELRLREGDNGMLNLEHDLSDIDHSLLAYLADDIETAHRANPNSWSFYRMKSGGVVLAVEAIAVTYVTKNGGGILVLGDPDSPSFQSVDNARVKQGYKYFPGFWIYADSTAQLYRLMEKFQTFHHEGIINLSNTVRTRTQRANEHQPATLDVLSSVVGRVLPQPAYKQTGKDAASHHASNDASVSKRYWKISPGPMGKYWKEFRDRSLIAVHWSDELADLSTFPDDQPAFAAQVKSVLGVSDQGAKSLWDFTKVIQPGDEVLAYANQAVVGSGKVTGSYELVDDDFEYKHRHPVSWISTQARPIMNLSPSLQAKLKTQVTLFELSPQQFAEALGQLPPAGPVIDAKSAIRDQFFATGLHYTDEQVAAFYTSLQTKGFVVLSGISGTGKSKIATGFAEMLPTPAVSAQPAADTEGMISVSIKPYMRTYKRINLPNRQVDLLPPLAVGEQVAIRVSVVGIHGSGRIKHRTRTGGSSITTLHLRGEVARAFADLEVGTRLYLRPTLGDDGDSIESVELLRPEELIPNELLTNGIETSTKHLFLSVRPDWRDSTSLLGYYNPLTQTYEWTEFLQFLLRAKESYEAKDGYAWFVIFDEMNLAHVEYYFADLLSIIESGRDSEGWTREPLRLTYPNTLDDDVPPHELRLPPNLYIIGTVNMDETTHAFSPKVLDRAFTIELTDVNFSDYLNAGVGLARPTLTESEKGELLTAFTRNGRFALIDKTEVGDIVAQHPRILADLEALNGVLRQHRMHFGYRVFDEICQYLFNNVLSGMMAFEVAFDQAVFMKVLPKFNGSRARLQSPLQGVLAWAIDPHSTSNQDVGAVALQFNAFYAGTAADAWTGEPAFPAVARRVRDMLVALERDGFVSFG